MKTEEEIKAVALGDARRIYRDLSVYNIELKKKGSVWEVMFTFKDVEMDGGGPFYEIDAETGAILRKVYYQ